MIDQLTVMLTNEKGRLAALVKLLGDGDVQMHALSVADTGEFGIVRIICDSPAQAKELLDKNGFQAAIAKVCAVEVPNVPGAAAKVFDVIDKQDVSVEYAYCFATANEGAVLAIKSDADLASILGEAGFKVLHSKDLYKN